MRNVRRLIYRPFNLLYLAFLAFLLFTVAGYFLSFLHGILVDAVGIPQEYFWAITLLSLIGSTVNLPLFVLESSHPVTVVEKIDVFGVRRIVPHAEGATSETLVTVNLGGAIIPVLVSGYLILINLTAVLQFAITITIIALIVHRVARIVPDVGILTPGFLPAIAAVFITLIFYTIMPGSYNGYALAYVCGTLGTLIGADILNLNKLRQLRTGKASIGGAGTFDGVFLTGILAVFLL